MNNIEFSIVPNKTNTKFKIAWTINLGDYPKTKVMSREFPTEDAAQEYLDTNKEKLVQTISERISKISINLKDEEVEVVAEVETEETVENTEEAEVETEETVENTEEAEVETEEARTALVPVEEMSLVPVEEEEEKVARTPSRKVKITLRVITIALAAFIAGVGIWHLIKYSNGGDDTPEVPGIETGESTTDEPEDDVIAVLTEEEFENLVAQLAKALQDKNVNLTTEEITKFVAIINIDSLAEENPELAKELFKDSTKEEFIQEAAKTISETVMYNGRVFEEEKSTENFIRISDALYGEEKEQLEIIEAYVDEIAKVYYDAGQVNILVSDLITRLATGDLQDLDNGTQFGMQASIELVRSYIAKDVLSEVNRDVLTDITRLNVSGIMSTYDEVNGLGNAKTLK